MSPWVLYIANSIVRLCRRTIIQGTCTLFAGKHVSGRLLRLLAGDPTYQALLRQGSRLSGIVFFDATTCARVAAFEEA